MLFPGVICPKYVLSLRIARYAASVNSGLSVAEPKYFFPAVCATVLDFAVEVEVGRAAVEVPVEPEPLLVDVL